MKILIALGLTAVGFTTVSCVSSSVAPLDTSGSYDPLDTPGGNSQKIKVIEQSSGPSFTPGQFVEAVIPDTGFYLNKPKGNADADKLLKKGSSMKVISQSGSFVKVELDNGKIGYVPSLHVDEPRENLTSSSIVDVTPREESSLGIPDLPQGVANSDDKIDFSDPIEASVKPSSSVKPPEPPAPVDAYTVPSTGPVDVTPAVPKLDSSEISPVQPGFQIPDLPEPAE